MSWRAWARACESIDGDVRDHDALAAALAAAEPEVVIHMAAQSLVRRSFAEPRETYETNVMGTVNVLDAVRLHGAARARGRQRDLRQVLREPRVGVGLPRGRADGRPRPVLELQGLRRARHRRVPPLASSPRSGRAPQASASARAGNVIGGGDWGEDRLVPDIMRAALAGERVRVRNPNSIRPWQHVLNPLSGYLVLAQALWESPEHARGWNFGPPEEDARPVGWIVERVGELWPRRAALDASTTAPIRTRRAT